MIANKLISRSVDYIMQHLDEEISIDDVAGYCHFSKFHFCRMFKAETGESVFAFIKRLRMEQSALNLKLEKHKSITDVGAQYGYSSSNFSIAFKKQHSTSPIEFRKDLKPNYVAHPYEYNSFASYPSFEEYDRQIQIMELDDLVVIHERHIGNYLDLGNSWNVFTEKYKDFLKEDTLLIERFYDDPTITRIDHCLFDICMTVDQDCSLDNVITIKGGKFAIYRFEGFIKDIFVAFQGAFKIWLANSGYHMDERYGLDIYRSINRAENKIVVDLCIPIQ